MGLLANFKVTTVDLRARKLIVNNEINVTCDAKELNLSSNTFDVVISLCALEHFGLGRYGDAFDIEADKKAFKEMIRVLKPNGRIIFTTTITHAKPSIAFNAHRIYSYKMIRELCSASLVCEDEKFYSNKIANFCSLQKVTLHQNEWDVYCGCWKKK